MNMEIFQMDAIALVHILTHITRNKFPGMPERHVGDLGNIQTDINGNANYTTYDDCIKLRGYTSNIIGRILIIHADQDDCGKGTGAARAESLKTGNSGKRIACAVIGYSKMC